jgi:hypothetical protein
MKKIQEWGWPEDGRSINGEANFPRQTAVSKFMDRYRYKLVVGLFVVGGIAFGALLIKAMIWPPGG